jgi:methanogenic corrinoid protein MtbC1
MRDPLAMAMSDLQERQVLKLVQERLEAGVDPLAILSDCQAGMALVGQRYQAGEYFVSGLIMASEVFKQTTALVGARCGGASEPTRGTVVVGTVKGDIHDMGKDLVVSVLKASRYAVHDLGSNVAPQKFVETVKDTGAVVVGLSSLLTIGFEAMKETVAALEAAGLRSKVKVMIGGAPVTEQVRDYAGADAVGRDAHGAVALCNQWIGG